MRYIVSIIFSLIFAAYSRENWSSKKQSELWINKLNKEVPVGSRSEKAEAWIAMNSIQHSFVKENREYHAQVEYKKFSGFAAFHCNDWAIYLTINVDENRRTIKNGVYGEGTCL